MQIVSRRFVEPARRMNITASNNSNLTENLRYECAGSYGADVRTDLSSFRTNNLAVVLVTSLGVMIALSMNSLILLTLYKTKTRSANDNMVAILASIHLFITIAAQLPFLLTKIYILADIWHSQNTSFCLFVLAFVHVGRLTILYSITCVFGITVDRCIASFRPIYFRAKKTKVFKLIAAIFLAQTCNAVCGFVLESYRAVAKIIDLVQVIGTFFFTLVAYVKIHYKLKRMPILAGRNNSRKQARQKRRAINATIIVSVILICFVPIAILQAVGVVFAKKGGLFLDLYLTPWLITVLFLSSSVNSIVYGVRNERLAESMKSHLESLFGVSTRVNNI